MNHYAAPNINNNLLKKDQAQGRTRWVPYEYEIEIDDDRPLLLLVVSIKI